MAIKLNIIDKTGKKNTIEAEEGQTIREAVMDKLAPTMYGLCGGNCICATCHVYVDEETFKKLEAPDENEIETMETNDIELKKNSRLSCQIELKKEYDNITLTLAHPT